MDFVNRLVQAQAQAEAPSSSLASTSTSTSSLSSVNLPLAKGQDFVFTCRHEGDDGCIDSCDILAVFDGHGPVSNDPDLDFMHHLRAAPLHELLVAVDPVTALVDYLHGLGKNYDAAMGAVGSIVRIYRDRIETFNVGDTATMIFLDGALVYKNVGHCSNVPSELVRLRETVGGGRFYIETSTKPAVVDDTKITIQSSPYTIFRHSSKPVKLAPSQSFGHHGITGYRPETATIAYSAEQRVHIVVASDGLMDMVSTDYAPDLEALSVLSAVELGALAERRWKQPWDYVYNGKLVQSGYRFCDFDDVGIVTWTLNSY